jgi:hypothetical protein
MEQVKRCILILERDSKTMPDHRWLRKHVCDRVSKRD